MKKSNLVAAVALAAAAATAQAGPPDTEAVEFYNVGTRHFFITASARDVSLIEQGAAGGGWVRTGRSFQAWTDAASAPASASPVCRFYSNLANSHFFSASAEDCSFLDRLEAEERARGQPMQGWMREGTAFFIEAPQGGQCPAGTVSLQRFYNLGFETGEGGNHRYVDDSELRALMADSGWKPEGIAFCARPKSTGTNANLRPTTTGFQALAGTWSGIAKFEVEAGATETETRLPLELTFSPEGAISGSGFGCAFTGQVLAGDGFRSLFSATVTASGCTDPSFDGEYTRVRLQRFETSLMVRLKQGDDADEVKIDGRLASADATPPGGTPGAGAFALAAGEWSGTVKWEVEAGGTETEVNRALALAIAADGSFTGTGFGCTLTGQLALHGASAVSFGGMATASGCENPAFDGDFPRVQVTRAASRLEVHFKREDASGEVKIAGKLDAGEGTTVGGPGNGPGPNPGGPGAGNPAAASDIVGSWKGSASLEVGTRTSTETLELAIGADGTLSGSGFGCTFAGVLRLTGARSAATGTVTASGCNDAAVDGTFREVEISLEDRNALEVELEREDGKRDDGTRVKVKARLARAV